MKKEIEDDPLTKAIAEYSRRTARGDVDMYVDILKRFIEKETAYRNKQKEDRNKQKEGGKT